VRLAAAKKLLRDSGASEDAQAKILGIVTQPGQDHDDASLERNQFNVLFALLGLALEGDDITLDGVDERKRSECLLTGHVHEDGLANERFIRSSYSSGIDTGKDPPLSCRRSASTVPEADYPS
jgi:hypothetical protein